MCGNISVTIQFLSVMFTIVGDQFFVVLFEQDIVTFLLKRIGQSLFDCECARTTPIVTTDPTAINTTDRCEQTRTSAMAFTFASELITLVRSLLGSSPAWRVAVTDALVLDLRGLHGCLDGARVLKIDDQGISVDSHDFYCVALLVNTHTTNCPGFHH